MVEKRWSVAPVEADLRDRLAREIGSSPILATLLLHRGISSVEEARRFLDPKLIDLHDPLLLPGMERAAVRIQEAVARKERTAICGDYDVDGLSATALLVEFFRLIGHPVITSIPHRIEEGYGLKPEAVRRLAAEGVRLIITVDNGSSAVEEIALAGELGIDVVVTDHHQVPAPPPAPLALVNPWAEGSAYPFPHLAGVGVAFKLVWAIGQRFSRAKKLAPELREFLLEALAFAALGTISDVVPLIGENRILACHGLRALERTPRPGLRALVEAARKGAAEPLTSEQVAFRIAPVINAAGRLGNADVALRLLLSASPEEARALAGQLDGENRRRQRIEEEILRSVRERVRSEVSLDRDRAIVLADRSWHAGVVGIVAARVAEEFCRPTLLIALDGDTGRGSARSIAGVHICEALARCRSHLIAFGGHAHAAGVEVAGDRVDSFRAALMEAIPIPPSEMVSELSLEAEVALDELDRTLLAELDRLGPCGRGNSQPLFLARALSVAGAPRVMGQLGQHLSFYVRGGEAPALKAVAFGSGALAGSLAGPLDLAFLPMVNRWQGRESIELNVKAIRQS